MSILTVTENQGELKELKKLVDSRKFRIIVVMYKQQKHLKHIRTKKLSPILVTILFVMAGCGGNEQSSGDLITVDVTATYPKKELILQDIFDVEYIPLETNDEFVTTADIHALGEEVIVIKNNNRISPDGNIYFFDKKSGKSLKKINRKGEGGEEYLMIQRIILDEYNDEIFVSDRQLRKILVYDLSGKYKRSFPHKEDAAYTHVYNFDRNYLICIDNPNNINIFPENQFLIISKQDGSVTQEIQISYEEKKTQRLFFREAGVISHANNDELIPYLDSWILVELSSDTIFRTQSDYSITPFIARTPSIQSMEREVLLFPGVLTDRYYFMQTVKKEYDPWTGEGWPRTNLVYDTKEKSIYESVVYNNDFSDKRMFDMVSPGYKKLINNSDIAFLHIFDAYYLVDAYKDGKLQGKLKEIAANLDEEDNPVIMLVKHKK